MKAGQSVEQLVGEKINEYVQIHKLGPKVRCFYFCVLFQRFLGYCEEFSKMHQFDIEKIICCICCVCVLTFLSFYHQHSSLT